MLIIKKRKIEMKKIKLLIKFIELKLKGYKKEDRYFYYFITGLISFEQYKNLLIKTKN